MKVKVAQSCPTLWPHGLYSPWNSLGQNTGVGSLSLLQGIFPTQESNPGLLHCRWILYQLSHKGSPVHNKRAIPGSSQSHPFSLVLGKPVFYKPVPGDKKVGDLCLRSFFLKNKMGMGLENIASQCQSTSESPKECVKSQIARPLAPWLSDSSLGWCLRICIANKLLVWDHTLRTFGLERPPQASTGDRLHYKVEDRIRGGI